MGDDFKVFAYVISIILMAATIVAVYKVVCSDLNKSVDTLCVEEDTSSVSEDTNSHADMVKSTDIHVETIENVESITINNTYTNASGNPIEISDNAEEMEQEKFSEETLMLQYKAVIVKYIVTGVICLTIVASMIVAIILKYK